MAKERRGTGGGKRRAPAPKSIQRTRLVVKKAGLVGVNWNKRAVSSSVYLMPADLCKDLGYWLNRRVAFVVGEAAQNGHGWTNLVCWPGRGMFAVTLALEDISGPQNDKP